MGLISNLRKAAVYIFMQTAFEMCPGPHHSLITNVLSLGSQSATLFIYNCLLLSGKINMRSSRIKYTYKTESVAHLIYIKQ